MRGLGDHDLVIAYNRGLPRHPVDRALLLLHLAHPSASEDELVALPIGRRDRLLLDLREATFGGRIDLLASCPRCGTGVQLGMNSQEVRVPTGPVQRAYDLDLEDAHLRFRLLDSRDLAMAVAAPRGRARDVLLRCALLELSGAVEPDRLAHELGRAIVREDPQCEILLGLTCPACARAWECVFDIVSYFWEEIAMRVRRIQRDIHTLARAYGWSEDAILRMHPTWRHGYLEMLARG